MKKNKSQRIFKKSDNTKTVQIELTNCSIAGMHDVVNKEGQEFRFRKRIIERCFPQRDSSAYAEQSIILEKIISLLGSKTKKGNNKITLTEAEIKVIKDTIRESQKFLFKLAEGAINTLELISIINEAGTLYRAGERGPAVQKIAWTGGKAAKHVPHADLFINYVFYMLGKPETRETRMQAIKYLHSHFKNQIQSQESIKKSLQGTRKKIRKINPDYNVIIPGDNEAYRSHNKKS